MGRPSIGVWRWGLGAAAVLAGAAVLWFGLGGRRPASEGPARGVGVFWEVPDFSLVERSGRQVTRADLKGKVWIATFFYTRCRDTCPLQMAEMARLQAALEDRDGVRLVAISVDPDHDTPAVLARYAERFNADPERWLFLTGRRDGIRRLAQEGFRLSAVTAEPVLDTSGKYDPLILHSARFVLVDGQARIGGYYESTDPEAMRRLREDLLRLLQERGEG